jgi:hypothetical protein
MPYGKTTVQKERFYEEFLELGPSGTIKALRTALREKHHQIISLSTLKSYCMTERWVERRKALFAARFKEEHTRYGYDRKDPLNSTCGQGLLCVAINPPYRGWGVRSVDSLCPECCMRSWYEPLP